MLTRYDPYIANGLLSERKIVKNKNVSFRDSISEK